MLALASGCKTRPFNSSTEPQVTHGTEVQQSEWPAVVKIDIGKNDNIGEAQNFCTGSAVSSYQILTAAHCVINLDKLQMHPLSFFVLPDFNKVSPKNIIAHPAYIPYIELSMYDMAIMEFEPGTFSVTPLKIDGNPVAKDEEKTLIGYGNDNEEKQSGATPTM